MSLRLRLALWWGGLTGLVLLVVAVLGYAAHSRGQYDDLDRALKGAVEHAAGAHAAATTSHEVVEMLAVLIAPNVVVRVYGPTGQVLAETPNSALAPVVAPRAVLSRPSSPPYDPLVGLAPPFATVGADGGTFGLAAGPDGDRWRLYVLPIDRETLYLVGAAPLSALDASVAVFRRLVPLLAGAGAGVTLLAGALLAHRALHPVALLTETAGAIARAREFGRRVPVPAGARRDELGHLAATFNEMLASLEQAYQAQQRFVADASHELRAPLTALQANLELLRRRRSTLSQEEQEEALGEVEREAHRLARLVADLLALARADAGVPLRRQRVELDRVVLDALAQARHLARGQRLGVEKLEPAFIAGDEDRLKQLFLILLDNALKYTPPGGEVTLALRRKGAAAEVSVRDTGVGIPPEDLPHVFERFYRADPARARDPGGTGLGLPIAQWIAAQHQGALTLASAPQQGTTATVRLPLAA